MFLLDRRQRSLAVVRDAADLREVESALVDCLATHLNHFGKLYGFVRHFVSEGGRVDLEQLRVWLHVAISAGTVHALDRVETRLVLEVQSVGLQLAVQQHLRRIGHSLQHHGFFAIQILVHHIASLDVVSLLNDQFAKRVFALCSDFIASIL